MRDEFEGVVDNLLNDACKDKSNAFGRSVGYNEIYEYLDTCKSRRGLVMKIHEAIKDTQELQAQASDDEDYHMYTGEIEAYKEFLKAIGSR